MNKSYLLAISVRIGLYSQINFAGSITDTYTTGDTLTTATLNNIKTAVNDNDTAKQNLVTRTSRLAIWFRSCRFNRFY